MKWLTLLILLTPMSVLACLQLKGEVRINQSRLSIQQKVARGKTYSFPKNDFIVNIALPKDHPQQVQYEIVRKIGNKLELLAAGDLLMTPGQTVGASSADADKAVTTSIKLELKNI
jgi:hypothetical protein